MWVRITQKRGLSGPKRSIQGQQPLDASLMTGSPVPRCCTYWAIAPLMLAAWLNKLATTVWQQQHVKLKLRKSPLYWTPCHQTGLAWWLRWSPVQLTVLKSVKQHCLHKMIQFHPHQILMWVCQKKTQQNVFLWWIFWHLLLNGCTTRHGRDLKD